MVKGKFDVRLSFAVLAAFLSVVVCSQQANASGDERGMTIVETPSITTGTNTSSVRASGQIMCAATDTVGGLQFSLDGALLGNTSPSSMSITGGTELYNWSGLTTATGVVSGQDYYVGARCTLTYINGIKHVIEADAVLVKAL